MSSLPLGAHLVTWTDSYAHHGIYVGDGNVVHFGGLDKRALRKDPIAKTSLEVFCEGPEYKIVKHINVKFSPEEVVRRALSKVGENNYHIYANNCEHFVYWCITGEKKSSQSTTANVMGVGAGGASGGLVYAGVSAKAAAEIAAANAIAASSSVAGGAGGVLSTGFPAGVAATSGNISVVASWLTPAWATVVAANPIAIAGGCVVIGAVGGFFIVNQVRKSFS